MYATSKTIGTSLVRIRYLELSGTTPIYSNNAYGNIDNYPAGFAATTPSLPTGTGSANAVTNTNTYSIRVYQTGESGTHIIDPLGTDKALPTDVAEVTLDPGAKIYYATTVATGWLWYGG